MAQMEKIIVKVLSGASDNNIQFIELTNLLGNFKFHCRIKGSHHIFWREGIEEIINLQPLGNKAKPYQVKQVRNLILKYKLTNDGN
jgi:hypothetical protein